ncbi:HIT domain-containing protein [Francisella philomiragia]|uniref:HIT family protein n=1 Tax=Francisella philomiragia TaxID=28110 RepID=A0ABS1GCH7_9GAMM|nr:HIT family protein [Francisella philomiragia]AJI74126.1 HIT domain protein [Francisella philomiragia subsp. philomiragia ATCC 25015]EET21595.1 histidine triad family protein [Francisella philomiragia subsp. philomiragia ATCC 25015]MBK2238024.1 HIT family protein [Francisella philomiragia]MBK2258452.1 HIT family protein [Francisella philomiragia]MBK2302378.1 HIT family protein [Francisella philomiragia]
MFKLDSRLEADTFEVCEYLDCKILLMNNSIVPWFIVVPFTDRTEWYQLDDSQQYNINKIINKLSNFIVKEYKADKLNIATIGNVVKQMHIHVVGRFENDPVWPAPVWGNIQSKPYTEQEKIKLLGKVKDIF